MGISFLMEGLKSTLRECMRKIVSKAGLKSSMDQLILSSLTFLKYSVGR